MRILIPSERDKIVTVVCAHFEIKPHEFKSRCCERRITGPRQVAFYLIYKLTGATLANIGLAFEKDVSTVRWAVQSTADTILIDRKFSQTVEALESRCKLLLEEK